MVEYLLPQSAGLVNDIPVSLGMAKEHHNGLTIWRLPGNKLHGTSQDEVGRRPEKALHVRYKMALLGGRTYKKGKLISHNLIKGPRDDGSWHFDA